MFFEVNVKKLIRFETTATFYNYLVTRVAIHLYYNGGNSYLKSPIRLNWGNVHRAGHQNPRAASSAPRRMTNGRTLRTGAERAVQGQNVASGRTNACENRRSLGLPGLSAPPGCVFELPNFLP